MELQGLKVVTAKEMARMEVLAADNGYSLEDFMHRAGECVAEAVCSFVKKKKFPKKVTILIGKGNKGGDAYVVAQRLLKKDFGIHVFHLYGFDECSALCRLQGERYLQMGGSVQLCKNAGDVSFEPKTVIIDGLLGTGFEGELEGLLLQVVQKANASGLPIIAIDIPSGLNGTSGEVKSSAMKATETIFLGLPKLGFFLKQGYNHVGKLRWGDIGVPTEEGNEVAYLVDEKKLAKSLPPIERTRHKYQAGYVIGIAGSKGMGGAAKLSSMAALRSGCGIVRLFYGKSAEEEMENAPMELIRQPWEFQKVVEAMEKAKALFIGPGMGRDKESEEFFLALLPKIQKPLVLDADALFILAKHKKVQLPPQSILTPHKEEMFRLLGEPKHDVWEKCQEYTNEHKVTLVLKGAPTVIFYPHELPLIVPRGDPGMATAGTGDVLTGIIASLCAQGLDTYKAAIVGVYLHAIAGEIAAQEKTSYGMIASDLIDNLPKAIKTLITLKEVFS